MRIHLNEGQLNRIVKKSVKRAINESATPYLGLGIASSARLLRQAKECIRDGAQEEAVTRIDQVISFLEELAK